MAARNESIFQQKDPDYRDNLPRRHRTAKAWQVVLQASTVIGIIVLAALLLNIIDGAFGYVATQNSIEPDDLVMDVQKQLMLTAPNTVSSEDDNELADGIAARRNRFRYPSNLKHKRHTSTPQTAPRLSTALRSPKCFPRFFCVEISAMMASRGAARIFPALSSIRNGRRNGQVLANAYPTLDKAPIR